jgi:hypothetical protein
LRPTTLAVLLGIAAALLATAGVLQSATGIIGVATFYALYRAIDLVVDTRCQERITDTGRATVTSVAAVGTELACFLVYAAWTLAQTTGIAILTGLMQSHLPHSNRPTKCLRFHGGGNTSATVATSLSRVLDG